MSEEREHVRCRGSDFDLYFRNPIHLCFLDREWDPKTKILNTFSLFLTSLLVADFISSCKNSTKCPSLSEIFVFMSQVLDFMTPIFTRTYSCTGRKIDPKKTLSLGT